MPFGLLNEIHYRELSVTGSYGCTRDQMEKGLQLLAEFENKLKLLAMQTVKLAAVPELLRNRKRDPRFKYIVEMG